MKRLIPILLAAFPVAIHAADVPKIFAGLFDKGMAVRGEAGVVIPPAEMDKYIAKVTDAAGKDPKWYQEYSKKTKPGVPLPYDPKLGLTKEEYDEYLKLWAKREFRVEEAVTMVLKESSDGTWTVVADGSAGMISTLRYDEKKDVFHSPDGDLMRIEDVNADAQSVLGAWTGREWKFEENTELGHTKENFALGKMAGGKYGLLIFRAQEVSSEGTPLMDKSLVVRIPFGAKGPKAVEGDANEGRPPGAAPAGDKPAGTKPAGGGKPSGSGKPSTGKSGSH